MKLKQWFLEKWDIVKEELTREPPKKMVKNYLYMFLGAIIVAICDSMFLIPMNIVSGGITSVSIILHSIPALSSISTSTYIMIFTWIFFFIGLIFLGVRYSLRTLAYTIAYPLLVMLFEYIISDVAIIDGVHVLDMYEVIPIMISDTTSLTDIGSLQTLSYVVSAVLGGVTLGTGIGVCMVGGGSSGGTDVINLIAHKYTGIKVGTSSFICDSVIICCGFLANGHNLIATLIGIISAFLCSMLIDKVFLGNSQYYMALIVSTKWQEINERINHELGRGTTLLKAHGGYTGRDNDVLAVCFDRRDYSIIINNVRMIDPEAFVTIVKTQEIVGYGFSFDSKKDNLKDVSITPDEAKKIMIKTKNAGKRHETTD